MKLSLLPLTVLLAFGADPKNFTFERKNPFDFIRVPYPNAGVLITIVTNTTTETRTVAFTNLMLHCVTTNSGGAFTNLVPIMTIGTNVGTWESPRQFVTNNIFQNTIPVWEGIPPLHYYKD